jgi:enoyl-CoA hydratase
MNATFDTLLFEVGPKGIATVTIHRPDKLNALNAKVMQELNEAIGLVESDDSIRGLVITGSGPKAFVAGADIAELSTLDVDTGTQLSLHGQSVFFRIETLTKPVIALVNGFALGGGCELAMACHLRVATTNAVFGLPEVGLGLIPGYGGTQRLTHLVGKGRALEMMLTAKPIKADQALAWGLVNAVASPEEAMGVTLEMMALITSKGPLAVASVIQAVLAGLNSADDGYEAESEQFGDLCGTADFTEGTKAFLEKRPPSFSGH